MQGTNLIIIIGYVRKIKLISYGDEENEFVFTATIAVPADEEETSFQYLKVSSFSCAEQLAELKEEDLIRAEGHFETKLYLNLCPHCGNEERRYWTNITVDSFIKLNQVE